MPGSSERAHQHELGDTDAVLLAATRTTIMNETDWKFNCLTQPNCAGLGKRLLVRPRKLAPDEDASGLWCCHGRASTVRLESHVSDLPIHVRWISPLP
jgi:hypothetical protein